MHGFAGDQTHFAIWAEILQPGSEIAPPGGFGALYEYRARRPERSWHLYPPGMLVILRLLGPFHSMIAPEGATLSRAVVRGIQSGADDPATRAARMALKLPGVIADVVLAGVIVVFVSRRFGRSAGLTAGAVFAMLPPVVFNSAVWGQVDSLFMLPIVLSLEMGIRRRPGAMAAAAAAAILIKTQAVIFAPIWLASAIVSCGGSLKLWGRTLGAGIGVLAVVILPILGEYPGILQSFTGATAVYPYTHLNGFSMWFLFHPLTEPHWTDLGRHYAGDLSFTVGGLPAKWIGLSLTLAVWCYAFARLIQRRCDADSVRWSAVIIPLSLFVLSTQMHERYLLPAVIAWLWACPRSMKGWALMGAATICVMLNMLWVWPGDGVNAWTRYWNTALHGRWFGFAAGQWCALLMVVVFVLTAAQGFARPNAKR